MCIQTFLVGIDNEMLVREKYVKKEGKVIKIENIFQERINNEQYKS